MKKIGIYQAKTHLSQLCEETARTGEACLISKNGKPLVKLVPVQEEKLVESVWDTVEESQATYGPLESFTLPKRRVRARAGKSCLDD